MSEDPGEQRRAGRWFEDLPVGLVLHHPVTRTVAEAGRPLVNGIFTVGLLAGISVTDTTHGTAVANLGMERVDFPWPVFAGDTIRVDTEIVDARPSASRPAWAS